jgi:hypothetical protein
MHLLYAWLFLLLGNGLHVLKRGRMYVCSAKVHTWRAFFEASWDVILVRTGIGSGLFWLYATQQGTLSKYVTLPEALPITLATTFMGGYFLDSIIDGIAVHIEWFKREIPQYEEANK